jgi:glycine/D-amino acid oxidase-like deaminating enzyme
MATVKTDYLVVGAGPAGASMACFLAQNGECILLSVARVYCLKFALTFDHAGLTGIVLSSALGSAETPRAHLGNPFALGKHPAPLHLLS